MYVRIRSAVAIEQDPPERHFSQAAPDAPTARCITVVGFRPHAAAYASTSLRNCSMTSMDSYIYLPSQGILTDGGTIHQPAYFTT